MGDLYFCLVLIVIKNKTCVHSPKKKIESKLEYSIYGRFHLSLYTLCVFFKLSTL